jgi:hypothetical protein
MRHALFGLVIATALAAAVPAQAVTVDDVMGLARAGASDKIILAKIDADGTVFHLTVDEILALRQAGVSDQVITYMINTGKGSTAEEPALADTEEQATYDQDTTGDYRSGYESGYQSGLDSRYRGSVSVSFGYYYPHWPGYWYSYYYDPFWWPSMSYYYCYWQPYPYSYWYYDPWYRWNAGVSWYWYPRYHDRYGRHHHDYYARIEKGRHVGGRGGSTGYNRVYKNGDRYRNPAVYDGNRRVLKSPSPDRRAPAERGRVVKSPRKSSGNENRLRKPEQPIRRVKPAPAPSRPNSGRELKPGRGSERRYQPAPRPSRGSSRGSARPSPSRGSSRSRKSG